MMSGRSQQLENDRRKPDIRPPATWSLYSDTKSAELRLHATTTGDRFEAVGDCLKSDEGEERINKLMR